MSASVPLLALGLGRCAVGALVFARPAVLARGMGVDSRTAESTEWIARLFGVRDLALGAGLLLAVRRAGDGLFRDRGADAVLRELLLLGVLCDTGDAIAVLAALRKKTVRPLPAAATIVTAVGAAGIGVVEAGR